MNCTVTFSCNDLPHTSMDNIVSPLKSCLIRKTWTRDKNDSFQVVYKYKGVELTKEIKERIENNNGIIIN